MKTEEKITFASYIIVAVFLVFIIRLWQLQIMEGKEYKKLAEQNRLRIIRVPAPRGIIFDRNNITLVKNVPYYTVTMTAGNPKDFNLMELANILDLKPETLLSRLNKINSQYLESLNLKEGLTFSELAALEARRSDFPGLVIETDLSREYPFGQIGSHLIGYLGKLSPVQSHSPEFEGVPSEAFIGQSGVEQLFDRTLRGTAGERIIEVDALGREIRALHQKKPIQGEDLRLSLDINLQQVAEKAFEDKSGALVALKPATGEILGFVSSPSFDPNLFSKGITYRDWIALHQDRKFPLLNRALQSQYPPGSTFKIVTAIAALEEGVINPDTKITCTGGRSSGNWFFKCWKKGGHGTLSLHRAIVESCDVYFYEVGKRVGIDKIAEYARKLGLGSESGLELAKERKGLIPDTAWKKEKKGSDWFLGDTFNSAIGQGYVAVTPIQMARLISAVSSEGLLPRPTLLKADSLPLKTGRVDLKQETIDFIKKALLGVVNEPSGTGWASRSTVTLIGGKTGTAQVVSMKEGSHASGMFRDHAWFLAFAPENPEIALSVFVEHGGHGGAASAPIAKKVIETYISNSAGSE